MDHVRFSTQPNVGLVAQCNGKLRSPGVVPLLGEGSGPSPFLAPRPLPAVPADSPYMAPRASPAGIPGDSPFMAPRAPPIVVPGDSPFMAPRRRARQSDTSPPSFRGVAPSPPPMSPRQVGTRAYSMDHGPALTQFAALPPQYQGRSSPRAGSFMLPQRNLSSRGSSISSIGSPRAAARTRRHTLVGSTWSPVSTPQQGPLHSGGGYVPPLSDDDDDVPKDLALENATLNLENEDLRRKMKQKEQWADALESQLTFILKNPPGSQGNKFATISAMQLIENGELKAHKMPSLQKAVDACIAAMIRAQENAMQNCLAEYFEHWASQRMLPDAEMTEDQVGVLRYKTERLSKWLKLIVKGFRVSNAFWHWLKCLQISRRIRQNPYVEGNEEANKAIAYLMKAVNGIATASATQSLPELYSHVTKLAVDITDAHHGYLFVVDPVDRSLHLKDAFEKEVKGRVRLMITPGAEGILGYVADKSCITSCPDLTSSELFMPANDRVNTSKVLGVHMYDVTMQNLLCFPLLEGEAVFDPSDIVDGEESHALPSSHGHKMMAMIYLCNKRSAFGNYFTSNDVANLQAAFHSTSDVIRAGQVFAEEKKRVRQLNGMLDIMSVDADEISLAYLSDRLVDLSKANRGTIYAIDDTTNELYFLIDTPDGKREIRMPLTPKSMAGACIMNNELINIPDCYADDRFNQDMDRKTGYKTTQMLCVPVVDSMSNPIGAIQVINTPHGMSFGDQDVELLQAFRVYIQIAIVNTKATTARDHAVRLARRGIALGTMMSWTETQPELLKTYFTAIEQNLDVEYVSLSVPPVHGQVLRYDNCTTEATMLPLKEGSGTHAVAMKYNFINVTVEGKQGSKLQVQDNLVAAKRQWTEAIPENIRNATQLKQARLNRSEARLLEVSDYPIDVYAETQFKNMLLLPIPTKRGTYVLTCAGKKSGHAFSILDEELVILSGQQFAQMMIKYDEIYRMHGLLEIMNKDAADIDLAFLSDKVVQLSKAQRGTIFVVNEKDGVKSMLFVIDTMQGKKQISIPLTRQSLAGACILDNKIINIPDVYKDSRFDSTMDQKTGFRTRQMLCVPVCDSDHRAIGAVQVLNSHTNRTFTEQDEELLTAFRGFIQITILNRQRHLSGLSELMNVDASKIDVAFLSDKVVEMAKAERGTIFILEEHQDRSPDLYFIIDTPEGKKEMRMPYSGKSMAGACMLTNEIINIPDCYKDGRFDPSVDKKTGFRTKQMLCVPITDTVGNRIGALQVINTKHGDPFSEMDVELLQGFRGYMQISIMNKGK